MVGQLVFFHRSDDVIDLALVDQTACGLLLHVQRIERDGAPFDVKLLRQFAHHRNLVGLVAHLELSEDQAAAILHGSHHHPPFARDLLRCATHLFQVERDVRPFGAVQGGPLAQPLVQGIGRQCRQDVVEGGNSWRGIALAARTPERSHSFELFGAQPGGKLTKRRHPTIAGKARRGHNRKIARQAVALTAGPAEIEDGIEKCVQAAQFRGRQRLLHLGPAVPLLMHIEAGQRLYGIRFKLVHEDLLGLSIHTPAGRPARLARIPARQPQPSPVRGAIAGPQKARRIHERLGRLRWLLLFACCWRGRPDLRALGITARERARAMFSWPDIAARTFEILQIAAER